MSPGGSATRRRGLPAVVALLVVVAAQAAMFFAAATRGLDLTDESFYFLTFQHWTEWPLVSLFGAYFSLPYALLGQSVWAIRALGFILLLAAGIWFSREVCRSFDALALKATPDGIFAASLAGGASIWNYYGAFIVPYTPSYNLLTLACALGTMALALRVGRAVFQVMVGRSISIRSRSDSWPRWGLRPSSAPAFSSSGSAPWSSRRSPGAVSMHASARASPCW
jgi:hypothetical protein